jgi:hypothetical protein
MKVRGDPKKPSSKTVTHVLGEKDRSGDQEIQEQSARGRAERAATPSCTTSSA